MQTLRFCSTNTRANLFSIKNDFSAQLHKFLASLTDTRWKLDGKTVLYVPEEGELADLDVAARDKDLLQRLESQCTQSARIFLAIECGCLFRMTILLSH